MFNYTYNTKSNILEGKAQAIIKLEDVQEHYSLINQADNLPRRLHVLIDCRNTIFQISPEEIAQAATKLDEAIRNFEYIAEAILIEQPYETVIATLFRNNIENFNYRMEIFYSKESALKWLQTEDILDKSKPPVQIN